MSVFVCDCHFLYDLFNVLIHGFDNTIHLRPIRGRIVILDLELFAQGGDHSIVQIHTIVYDDPLRDTIMADEILFNELGYNIFGHGSERGCLNPLREVIDRHQDEAMPIGCCRSDFTDHIDAPHCKRPRCHQDIQRNRRDMHLVSIDLAFMTSSGVLVTISFHCGPEISCPKDFLGHGVSTGMCSKCALM